MDKTARMRCQLGIANDLGWELPPGAVIVDLGCGDGELVHEFRTSGYEAYGCDYRFKPGPHLEELARAGAIRTIADPYRLPFDDESVDLALSDQVFEHVSDYPTTLAEIRRVLKPQGLSLHIFPSRYSLLEPHVGVPGATILRGRYWLLLWAIVGIRSSDQHGMSPSDVAAGNHKYLNERTFYIGRRDIQRYAGDVFPYVRFCERQFLKHSARGRVAYALSRALPFIPALYSGLRSRVLVLARSAPSRV